MERLAEIVREGTEHISRKLKSASLKSRIKKLSAEQEQQIARIGETAWQECLSEVESIEPEIGTLDQERKSIISEMEGKIEALKKELSSKQANHDQQETKKFEFTDDLEELLAERSKLRAQKAEIEAEIKLQNQKSNKEEGEKDSGSDSVQLTTLENNLAEVIKKQGELQERIDHIHDEITSYRKKQQRFIEDISKGEKEEIRIQKEARKKLDPIEKKIKEHCYSLGQKLVNDRPECIGLENEFSDYDLTTTTLEAAKNSLNSEQTLLELLDRKNVMLFYSFSLLALAVVIVVIWLVALIFFL